MTDIVDRLRGALPAYSLVYIAPNDVLLSDAAAEIERLRREVARLRTDVETLDRQINTGAMP